MQSIAFFNNKGGVGKTTFTYHLAYALESIGKRVLLLDGDPQCNLTAHVCEDDIIDQAWKDNGNSLFQAIKPFVTASGDLLHVEPFKVGNRNIWIFPGDLMLSEFDAILSETWVQVLAGQERGFRVTTALHRLFYDFANKNDIDYVLIDLGPNLGSLNRALLLSCDYFVLPIIPDLFSLRGSQNLGKTMANWTRLWKEAVSRTGDLPFQIPTTGPKFAGYILQQFNVYRKKPTKAWEKWTNLIPDYIQKYVVEPLSTEGLIIRETPSYKLGEMQNYHSLIPMAQTALKPVFELTSNDGVKGDHHKYVKQCGVEYSEVANIIMRQINI